MVETPEVEALGLPLMLDEGFDAPVVTHLANQREFDSASSLVAPHAVMPCPPRMTPTACGLAACTQTSTVVLFGSSAGLTTVTLPSTGSRYSR